MDLNISLGYFIDVVGDLEARHLQVTGQSRRYRSVYFAESFNPFVCHYFVIEVYFFIGKFIFIGPPLDYTEFLAPIHLNQEVPVALGLHSLLQHAHHRLPSIVEPISEAVLVEMLHLYWTLHAKELIVSRNHLALLCIWSRSGLEELSLNDRVLDSGFILPENAA